MKQKGLILLAAAVAVMLVACEPEKIVTPEPTPTGPTYLTSLVGTVWNCHEDYWMEDVPYVGTMHVLMDTDLSFLTDSTGTRHTYSDTNPVVCCLLPTGKRYSNRACFRMEMQPDDLETASPVI